MMWKWYQVTKVPGGIRLFHLNGDEIAATLQAIGNRQRGFLTKGYNVVLPAWELPRYPEVWARELNRFHEVWAPTAFVEHSLKEVVTIPVHRVPNACEPHISTVLDRSAFGIPADDFAILCFFDVRSYTTRKNPWAAIDAFAGLVAARPQGRAHLILKLNYGERDPHTVAGVTERLAAFAGRAMLIDATLTDNETKNLIRCCDCILSLHRSEGFGRGPAEAMFFGKPVVATGWSGNMDYMDERTAFPVRYTLHPVQVGTYPHAENQVWADADVSHATECLIRLVDDPALRRSVGEQARLHMRSHYSDQVLGAIYRRRLAAIARLPIV